MIRAAVIGATGYAGAELMKLLIHHPQVSHVAAATRSYEGIPYSQVYPNFISLHDDVCLAPELDALADEYDVLFLSLPHGLASSAVTEKILSKTRIIDLGADFRLHDADTYEAWYKTSHHGRALLSRAVYGLSELYREKNRRRFTDCKSRLLYHLLHSLGPSSHRQTSYRQLEHYHRCSERSKRSREEGSDLHAVQ